MLSEIDRERCHFIKPTISGELDRIKYPAIAQIKYDGEICWADIRHGKCTLYSEKRIGRVREKCAITDELEVLGLNTTTLVGELYYGDGKNWAQFMTHKLSNDLNLAVFDVMKWDGHSTRAMSLNDRLDVMKNCFKSDHVHLADSMQCYRMADAEAYFDDTIYRNYEGIVVKTLSGTFKYNIFRDQAVVENECYAVLPVMGFSKRVHKMSLLVGMKNSYRSRVEPLAQCKVDYSRADINQLRQVLQSFVSGESEAYYLLDSSTYLMVEVRHGGVLYNLRGSAPYSLRSPEFIRLLADKTIKDLRIQ